MNTDTVNDLKAKVAKLEEKVKIYEKIISSITPGSFFSENYLNLINKHSLSFNRTEFQDEITTTFSSFMLKNKEILQTIFDAIPHHILFIDPKGIIQFYNEQCARDFKVNIDEYVGKHIRELLRIEDKEIALLNTLYSGKEIYHHEILNKNYGIVNTRIIRDMNNQIESVIGIFHFLNDARDSEKLAISGRIAAGIAHEVRNPLTTVRGYLQFVQDEAPERIKQLFNDLLIPELDRANGIITDFLSITKNAPYKPEPVCLNDFLLNYIKQLFFSETVINNVDIRYNLSEELHKYKVFFDRNQLVQVFLNLFHNSLDAKKDGNLLITIETHVIDDEIVIIFKDNGCGIPRTVLPFIFDAFYSTKDEGTGLGLSLTKKLIQNHGGFITAASSCNGTEFTISLPINHDNKK
ncbi:ATP-binding protein [Gottfriedia sp. OAE603]|uniref:two-component system sensor histidine kinase NtrB n=1 Tax=Gottfriedia sp. OAE603 TaxID=2663872 RepID=UPI00178AF075